MQLTFKLCLTIITATWSGNLRFFFNNSASYSREHTYWRRWLLSKQAVSAQVNVTRSNKFKRWFILTFSLTKILLELAPLGKIFCLPWQRRWSLWVLSFYCMNASVSLGLVVAKAVVCSQFPCVCAWESRGTNSCFFIHISLCAHLLLWRGMRMLQSTPL